MAGITKLLKPSRLIRRKAMYAGVLGPSTFWKVVAAGVFGKSLLQNFFGKQTEVLDLKSFGPGKTMTITTAKPLSKKQRKQLKKRGEFVSLKEQRAAARMWAETVAAEKAAAKKSSRFKFWKR